MGARTAVKVDVARVPRVELPKGTTLERIYRVRDAEGRPRSPWYFSSRDEGEGGRFDLAQPAGTCYLAGDLDSAFRETFRGARVIAEDDVARRHVLTARATRASAPWADLSHELAAEGGVTLDAFSGPDYVDTQAFGAAGPSDEPSAGWTAEQASLLDRVDHLAPHLRSRIRPVPRAMRPTNPHLGA